MKGRLLDQTYHALVYASQPNSVYLRDIRGLGLQKLLEDDPVLCHLASCNSDAIRFQRFSYCSMSQNVVWTCRLWTLSACGGVFASTRPPTDLQ